MPALRAYKIFISPAWDYSEASNFDWENLSAPEHDPVKGDDLEYDLRNQMRPANAFLIIAGMYSELFRLAEPN